jgi:hypothetical protein
MINSEGGVSGVIGEKRQALRWNWHDSYIETKGNLPQKPQKPHFIRPIACRSARYTRCPVCHAIRLYAVPADRCESGACGSVIPSDALLAAKDRDLQAMRSALGIGTFPIQPELVQLAQGLGSTTLALTKYATDLVPPEERKAERAHWMWFYMQRMDRDCDGFPGALSSRIDEFRKDLDLETLPVCRERASEIEERRKTLRQIEADLLTCVDLFRAAIDGRKGA